MHFAREIRPLFRNKYSIVAVCLLLVHAALLAWVAECNSPTLDEVAHLPAGLSIWHFGRFDLYRVNPPLMRMLAAAPVALAGPHTDWKNYGSNIWLRPAWQIGRDFIAANGEQSFRYFTLARWALIPVSLIGGFVCFRWARDLYGPESGILALALWCFSPNIIAHASMITSDAGGAALGVAAGYVFWRWLKNPRWHVAIAAGFLLGLAQLTKSTWIILFALWPVLWIVWGLAPAIRTRTNWLRQAAQLATIGLFGVYVLNLGYLFEGSFQKLGDFTFTSRTLAGPNAPGLGNRFAGSWLGDLPVPVPADYLVGIDIQKHDFENSDDARPSYLHGEWRNRGWWYYYLYALTLKVPLGSWCLVFLAAFVSLAYKTYSPGWRDAIALWLPALGVLILVSSQTGFSRHLRYVLPGFPFVLIWTSMVAQSRKQKHWGVAAVAAAAVFWSVGSNLSVYPHSLSYFNELAGGPLGGHAHLVDSNIDWGQDLLFLKRWHDEHPRARPLHLAYFGFVDPRYAGIQFALPPKGPPGPHELPSVPIDQMGPQPGWFAVSVNFLRGYRYFTWDQAGSFVYLSEPYYSYFLRFEPTSMAGYSIYIYHVTTDDANRVRAELGLPLLPEMRNHSHPVE